MKYVNLFGCTTAEKLIAFEKAIDDLYSELGNLGWYVTKEGYVNEQTFYNTQYITQSISENSFIGRPIYFANNSILAIVNTYNPANGEFTITNAQTLRGKQGEQGVQGEEGEAGNGIISITNDAPQVVGAYTNTPIRVNYTNGTQGFFQVLAKNGDNYSGQQQLYRHYLTFSIAYDFGIGMGVDRSDIIIEVTSIKSQQFNLQNIINIGTPTSADRKIIGRLSNSATYGFLIFDGTLLPSLDGNSLLMNLHFETGFVTFNYSTETLNKTFKFVSDNVVPIAGNP